MSKKEILIPFVFIGLSAVFLFICAMVYFSGGKSKQWVARKMRIGGILLSLSFFSCGSNNSHIEIQQTCYMIVPDYLEKVEVSIDSNKIIYGNIWGRFGKDFSYALMNNKGAIIQKNNLFPKRYSPDNEHEEFVIELNQKLDTGKYQLKLYNCKTKEQEKLLIMHEQELIIKK
jgi:hypothetical protein